jgi:tetratricopeptide (TPR) repeat protein
MTNMDFYEERIKELAQQAEERARRGKKIARANTMKAKGSFDKAAKLYEEGCSLCDVIPADYRNWFIVLRKMNARDMKAGEYELVIERVRTMIRVDAERDRSMLRGCERSFGRKLPSDHLAKDRNLRVTDARAMFKAAKAVGDKEMESIARNHVIEFESDRPSVMANWKLEKQCAAIGAELTEVELEISGRVEMCALDYFRNQGFKGLACEGAAVFIVLDALVKGAFNKMVEPYLAMQEPNGAFPARIFSLSDSEWREVEHAIVTVGQSEFARNLEYMSDWISQYTPDVEAMELFLGFDAEALLALENALGRNRLLAIARKLREDPYVYRNGWPDLTLVRGSQVRFVEVKRNDSLIASQLTTIPAMIPLLGVAIEVLRVRDVRD